jgi:hypothetical protein
MTAALLAAAGASAAAFQPTSAPKSQPGGKAPQPPIKPAQPPTGAPPMDEQTQQMLKDMQPGPEHVRLQKLAGDWTTETTMEGMPQPVPKTAGTEKISSSLGGRFLHEQGTGEMMGMPMESFKVWGYNNGSHKYEATWTWTMSTSLLHMTGESKDGGKTIDWQAWFEGAGGKREEFKCQHAFTDDDHFTVKMYGGKMPDGTPGPTMTSVYTRKK